jgi:hypothetical protein
VAGPYIATGKIMHTDNSVPQADELDSEADTPFDYLMSWGWPDHIETALRRLMWIWFVELAEQDGETTRSGPDDHTAYVKWLIAVHPESPPAVLDVLADEASPALLERIAENPATAPDTLARLASCQSPDVRIAVSRHPCTPPAVLAQLCTDEHPDVRYALAENPTMAGDVLRRLAWDDNPFVAARASQTTIVQKPTFIHQGNFQKRDRGTIVQKA